MGSFIVRLLHGGNPCCPIISTLGPWFLPSGVSENKSAYSLVSITALSDVEDSFDGLPQASDLSIISHLTWFKNALCSLAAI